MIIIVLTYLSVIVLANVLTVAIPPLHLLGLLIPTSSWFMGLTFILGNRMVKEKGTNFSNVMIGAGLVLSSVACFLLGYSQAIVIASGVAFLISQLAGTYLYRGLTKLDVRKSNEISSMTGSFIDVILFVVIGLSPLGTNAVQWIQIPNAVLGQLIVQLTVQYIAIQIMNKRGLLL